MHSSHCLVPVVPGMLTSIAIFRDVGSTVYPDLEGGIDEKLNFHSALMARLLAKPLGYRSL